MRYIGCMICGEKMPCSCGKNIPCIIDKVKWNNEIRKKEEKTMKIDGQERKGLQIKYLLDYLEELTREEDRVARGKVKKKLNKLLEVNE